MTIQRGRSAMNQPEPLPPPENPRLTRALEEYQAALERGTPFNRQELLARYPEIAEQLADCLDGLEFVHGATAGLPPPSAAESSAGDGATKLHTAMPLGDFRLLREGGRGGMGVVYE